MLKTRKILLDTNFLLIPGLFKLDIFEEIRRIADFPYKLCILAKSIDELEKIIKEQRGKNKRAAELARQLIKSKDLNIMTLNSGKSVDDLLFELKEEYIIATQDKELKKRIKNNIIVLKQKKYLKLERGGL